MKPINKTKITYLKLSNMMTNKEVVSVQKLQMTYPLSAKKKKNKKNTNIENKKNTCIQIWRLGSQSKGSQGEVLFYVDEQNLLLH